jgi:hypothetical protein
MAAAVYTTDLLDITLAETGTFVELTGWLAGTLSTGFETDYFIQGTTCKSSSVKTTQSSIGFDLGSTITVPTDGAVLVWQVLFAPNSLDSFTNGGMRVAIGNSTSAFYEFYTGGVDRYPNPYGGWVCSAVNPNITTARDATTGAPNGSWQVFGTLIRTPTTYPSKGAPMGLDAIRYGRCEIRASQGDSSTPANFTDMAAKNDANDATNGYNRWGLFSYQGGAFSYKGLMSIGYTGATYFLDTNKVVNIEDTRKVTADFNTIAVSQSGTTLNLTNCVFAALGSVSSGKFIMYSGTTVILDTCLFKDMSTFTFNTGATVTTSSFVRCNTISTTGGSFIGTSVLLSSVTGDTSAFIWSGITDCDGYMNGMTFSKGTNDHHAIGFGNNIPSSITLRDMTFSGFNAANSQNNSTLYFYDTAGTITVNLVGCSGNISYKSAGATINLVTNPVTLAVTVRDIETQAIIPNARVLIWVANGTNFSYHEPVTITSAGTTATVSHPDHGLVTNDDVIISGATPDTYNGAFKITVTGLSGYTYTLPASATSPATGTIVSTLALINELTDVSGNASDSRSYAVGDQTITGWVRKGTSSPYYKQQPISDTVDSVNGLNLVVQLIRDE